MQNLYITTKFLKHGLSRVFKACSEYFYTDEYHSIRDLLLPYAHSHTVDFAEQFYRAFKEHSPQYGEVTIKSLKGTFLSTVTFTR